MNKKNKIRLLIADDSFFMKKLLRNLISQDKKVEIVGEARDGEEVIEKALELNPDIIIMDYKMPKLNGAKAIKEIFSKSTQEKLPAIIMLSAYTPIDSEEALECLRAGALDLILKPSGEVSLDIEKVQEEILTKIHTAYISRRKKEEKILTKTKKLKIKKIFSNLREKMEAVVIGASTGGPVLIEQIITKLPSPFPAIVLVAQHMPKFFVSKFAKRLNNLSNISVKEANMLDRVERNTILLAPGDQNMSVDYKKTNKKNKTEKQGKEVIVFLEKNEDDSVTYSSINNLMSSVSKIYKKKTLGVVLSGMGEDSLEGAREIKKQGGYILVQDPETATIGSMPEAVIKAGLADEVLVPNQIIRRIIELTK